MPDSQKPVRHIRRGHIQAAIWRNEGDNGPYYITTFERRYRDEEGEWKSTHGFGRDDVLLLSKVADLALDAIFELQEADRPHPPGNGHDADGSAHPNSASRAPSQTNNGGATRSAVGRAARDSRSATRG